MKAVLLLGMMGCVLVAGCVSSADPGATGGGSVQLEGTEWTLSEINGKAVSAAANVRVPTLKLDAATKRVSGNSGVNRYSGGYELEGTTLKFGGTMGTRMAGPPEAMELEKSFLDALGKVREWRVKKGELDLTDGSGGKVVLMKFRKG